jgi:hypothetical protein
MDTSYSCQFSSEAVSEFRMVMDGATLNFFADYFESFFGELFFVSSQIQPCIQFTITVKQMENLAIPIHVKVVVFCDDVSDVVVNTPLVQPILTVAEIIWMTLYPVVIGERFEFHVSSSLEGERLKPLPQVGGC